MDFTVDHERHGSVTGSKKDPNGTLCVKNIKNRDRPIEKAAYDKRTSQVLQPSSM